MYKFVFQPDYYIYRSNIVTCSRVTQDAPKPCTLRLGDWLSNTLPSYTATKATNIQVSAHTYGHALALTNP